MEPVFQECPDEISQSKAHKAECPTPRLDACNSRQSWECRREIAECDRWERLCELLRRAKEEICRDGEPDYRYHVPGRLCEDLEIGRAEKSGRVGDMARLMDLLQVETLAAQ